MISILSTLWWIRIRGLWKLPDRWDWLWGNLGLTHLKRPWYQERLRAGGEGDDRGWDGWMASPTRWIWVWARSESWWWRGKPGVLQSMGLQRVRQSQTELMVVLFLLFKGTPILLFLEAAPIYCPTNSVGNNMHALFKHALLSNVNLMCMIQRGIIRGCTFYHVL